MRVKPFFATWLSTKAMIKKEMKESGPKDAVSIVSHKVGGVVGAVASGQLLLCTMLVTCKILIIRIFSVLFFVIKKKS